MPNLINLDHAAGAPLGKEAKKALKEFIESDVYNPDSAYAPAVKLRRDLSETKSKIAKLIGTKAPNILITSGSSDATSKLVSLILNAKPKSHFITTNIEHSGLIETFSLSKNLTILKVEKSGKLDLSKLKSSIKDSTTLISVQYVNNETGQVLPIKEISKIVKDERQKRLRLNNTTPLFLHTDASQAAITQDLHIPRLGVDAMSLNGSKFGASPASGILYLSSEILRWLEEKKIAIPKTKENPLSTISLYYALNHTIEKRNSETKRLLSLSKTFQHELFKQIPDAKLNPSGLKIGKNHSPHILNFTLPGISGERLVILAGLNNILISTGAACSASKDIPSHVLQALDLSLEDIQSSIRVSFGSANRSEKEVKDAAQKLAKLCTNPSVKL